MRIWLCLLLLFSTFYIGTSFSYAQDPVEEASLPDLPEETSLPSDDLPNVEEEKTKSLYARATDTQLKEAQRFYKKCTSNESMNERKNCKCAATSYLETRITLGDEGSVDDIMKINRNKCLKNENDALNEDSKPLDVTDAQRKEAEEVYHYCKTNYRYRIHYECDCFAARFLDERIKQGPLISRADIFGQLRMECRNVVEKIGIEYTSCMTRPMLGNIGNIELKDYCECYAREWARLYEAYAGSAKSFSEKSMTLQAKAQCRDPAMYQ